MYLPSWQRAGKVSWCALRTFSMSSPTSGVSAQLSELSGLGASFFFLFLSFLTAVEGADRRSGRQAVSTAVQVRPGFSVSHGSVPVTREITPCAHTCARTHMQARTRVHTHAWAGEEPPPRPSEST